jgi:hypothetical protein
VPVPQQRCLAAARFGNFGPAVETKSKVAYAGPGKRRTVTRIARGSPVEQVARLEQLSLPQPGKVREGAGVDVIAGMIARRAVGRHAVSATPTAGSMTPATLTATCPEARPRLRASLQGDDRQRRGVAALPRLDPASHQATGAGLTLTYAMLFGHLGGALRFRDRRAHRAENTSHLVHLNGPKSDHRADRHGECQAA